MKERGWIYKGGKEVVDGEDSHVSVVARAVLEAPICVPHKTVHAHASLFLCAFLDEVV